ncbi:Hypothetical protein R9X50_00301300 [Acrodontium crateriforme]|uniref:Uncharacterized protein n=1 Tax=Acrodontium crateriforme TaxID=150365 RepID=A0AAQ3M2I4_9PEZI|nr:Hypothetical protein R9X50_00301300 [Acrodontium crateriforme]
MGAAFNHQHPGSRASLSRGHSSDELLPGGCCNFRDLSNGARAPKCGCTRFWLNTHFNGHDPNTERVWCFCGHHACYHEAFSKEPSRIIKQASLEPSRPVAVTSTQTYKSNAPTHGDRCDGTQTSHRQALGLAQISTSQPRPSGLGICAGSQSQVPSINTRVWEALNAFAREQEDGRFSITTSQLPSTATPSVAGDQRISPSRLLQDQLLQSKSMRPPVTIPTIFPAGSVTEDYSATEVATPSISGTPDFRALARGAQVRSSPSNMKPTNFLPNKLPPNEPIHQTIELEQQTQRIVAETLPSASAPSGYMSMQDVQNLLRGYGQRIEVLESLSFSHMPLDELQDKLELFDGRLLDVEQWRGDHEQTHVSLEEERAQNKNRRMLPMESSSFGSDGSYDHNAAMHTEAAVLATLAANAETGPRFDALESRIADLEYAAMPSFAHPWHVEVVLLPWGPALSGVWFSSAEATQHSLRTNTQASDEWSGSHSAPKTSFDASSSGAWTTESIQAWADESQDWLSPKACGPSGTVYQRLASRGLIQEIELTAPDSRHILNTITSAFASILEETDKPNPPEADQYQGLRERFIPLRKARKSSRLRFLGTPEMVTSATWGAGWLDSSVFMKVNDGQRRLYITTAESYLQSAGQAWTWPKIRKLPMSGVIGATTTADLHDVAIEACWSYNDRLDQLPSLQSSFASHESQWSLGSSDSNPESPAADQHLKGPRPYHHRTVSMPSVNSGFEHAQIALPKRRVASFETPAPLGTMDETTAAKRRRMDPSPEAERRGVGLTPRWSREPPSPFTVETTGEARSQGASSGRKRGFTPFAYATPHSNATYSGHVAESGGDGDTEADDDMGELQGTALDDEWNGSDEHDEGIMQSSDDESSVEFMDSSGRRTSYKRGNSKARSNDCNV